MKTLLSFALFLLSLAAQAQMDSVLETPVVKVTAVHDAQVLTVYSEEYQWEYMLVLAGMHAPGLDQPLGKEAREFVAKAILGKTVPVGLLGTGAAGAVAVIYTPEGRRLDALLIENGLAQVESETSDSLKLQDQAKSKKLGIWKDGKAVDLAKDWLVHHPKVREEVEKHKNEQQEEEE